MGAPQLSIGHACRLPHDTCNMANGVYMCRWWCKQMLPCICVSMCAHMRGRAFAREQAPACVHTCLSMLCIPVFALCMRMAVHACMRVCACVCARECECECEAGGQVGGRTGGRAGGDCVCACACMHVCTRAHAHACAYMCMRVRACVRACMRVCVCARTCLQEFGE